MSFIKYTWLILLFPLHNVLGQEAFNEVSESWGIEHYHRGLMGGGVAIFDFNNDGFEDIYLTGGTLQDQLYKNNGNKTFTKVSARAGFAITENYSTMSVSAGDINNDGYMDLFVGTAKSQQSRLFLNNGDNTFSDISDNAGFTRVDWTIGATFGDFNLDGFLDIYIINYIKNAKLTQDISGEPVGFDHECYPNTLYINNGDLTFTQVSDVSATNNQGCGLAVAATDLNNDNLTDIYVANDFGAWVTPNASYLNNYPQEVFTDNSLESGLNAAIYGMGIAIGDFNRDGFFDYYISNLGSNVLYRNEKNGTFTDIAMEAGVLNTNADNELATSWGTAFFDYDHDGFEDLFVANGFVPSADFVLAGQDDPNKLYRNRGDGTFEDVSSLEGLGDDKISRGMAVGDLDNDGDMDIVVTIVGISDDAGNVRIYENMQSGENSWLKVILSGVDANLDSYGAKVQVYGDGILWIHEIDGGSSHGSHNSSLAHFGLGQTTIVDSLVVIWPGGEKQKFVNIEINQTLRIQENSFNYEIAGCMSATSSNFNSEATYNYGCFDTVEGCLEEKSSNFNIDANVDDGSCDIVTAIGDIEFQSLSVFPNPMTDFVSIQLPDGSGDNNLLQLLDLTGKVVRTTTIGSSHQLNRGSMRSGTYLLRIYSKEKIITRKLIVR